LLINGTLGLIGEDILDWS